MVHENTLYRYIKNRLCQAKCWSILSSKMLGKVELRSDSIKQNAEFMWDSVPFYPGKSGTRVHFILGKVGPRSGKVGLGSILSEKWNSVPFYPGNVELRSILMLVKEGLSSILSSKLLGKWDPVPFHPAKCWECGEGLSSNYWEKWDSAHFIWDLVPKMLGKVEPRPSLSSKMLESWSILSSILSSKLLGKVGLRSILSSKLLGKEGLSSILSSKLLGKVGLRSILSGT